MSNPKDFKLEDIITVPTRCEDCKQDGEAPTFKQYFDNEEHPIVQMIGRNGYVDILCAECAAKKVDQIK